MQSTKERIKKVIKEYIKLFPLEYESFCNSHRIKQENKVNEFAEFKGSTQLVRHLVDVPETLYFSLRSQLQPEQFDWLYGFNDFEGKREGMTWFIRTFPQFKITDDF